jgi:hypothetical protein
MSQTDDFVFHFSSAGALLSILTERQLWATDVEYLNDKFEGQLPSRMLGLMADKPESFLQGFSTTRKHQEALKLSLNHGLVTCSVSFSEYYRSLPQYRMYCPPAGGYAIGFRKDYLSKLGLFLKCDYSNDNLRQWCRKYALKFLSDAASLDKDGISPQELCIKIISSNSYIRDRVIAGLTFKSDEFVNEREHRLVLFGLPKEYRESQLRNAIVPYSIVALPNEETSVMVAAGPNREPGYSGRTIGSLSSAARNAGTVWKFSHLGTGEFGFRA